MIRIEGGVRNVYRLSYNTWRAMLHRCSAKTASDYKHYGGKAIKVCKRWRIFFNFLEDMGERPNRLLTLDRIDNKKGYTKKNCRWATQSQQLRNYSRTRKIKIGKKIMCLKDACKHHQIRYATVVNRILKYGWGIEEALSTPPLWTCKKTSVRNK